VPLQSQAGPEWPINVWREVDKVNERSTFQALAWLLEPVRHVQDNFSSWQPVEMPTDFTKCERCAPTAPALEWRRVNKKDVPFENTVQAGEYERSLKRRPSPFVTQLRLDDNGMGTVRLGINTPSLIHRALSRLPSERRTELPTVSWRLNTDFTPLASLHLPKFVLSSNKLDPEHSQPPNFKIPLRKEQLRSLYWMLKQEARDATPFVEEEISEAILAPLGWRAEGRAQRPVHVRGGVLADQVGYGKTAITLGLIDCTSKTVKEEFQKLSRTTGKIRVKATAVIVPPHLTKQWDSECRKFAGKRFKTVVLSTATSLNSLDIEQVQEADIVIVASNLFKSSVYLDNLESFAAGTALPNQDGRYFNDRLHVILASLQAQTDRLQDEGPAAVIQQMRKFRREGGHFSVCNT
jgi:SNF2-related domain